MLKKHAHVLVEKLENYAIFDENRLGFVNHTAGYPESVTFALA